MSLLPVWLLKLVGAVLYWLKWDRLTAPVFLELHRRGYFWSDVDGFKKRDERWKDGW